MRTCTCKNAPLESSLIIYDCASEDPVKRVDSTKVYSVIRMRIDNFPEILHENSFIPIGNILNGFCKSVAHVKPVLYT